MLPTPVPLDDQTRARLAEVSTATLTTQLRKRGVVSVFIKGVAPLDPAGGRVVGPAFTLRHIPAREDITRPELRAHPDYAQRRAIEEAPPGHVLVMDCRGKRGAGMAGDILVRRLIARGVAGLVADGPMRDAAAIAKLDLPVFCAGAAAPQSMTLHHAIAVGEPIACGEVAVLPGDVIVGDGDGVVVVPSDLAAEVAAEAIEQERFERFVFERVAAGHSIAGLYPPDADTIADYARWCAKRDG